MTNGIDVSGHNPNTNWDAVTQQRVDFAIIKATQGTSYLNPWFNVDWIKTKQHGVVRGAYHFFNPYIDPIEQAKFFLNNVTLKADDLPAILDLELINGTDEKAFIADDICKWVEYVTTQTKKQAIIYGSPYFLEDLKFDPDRVAKVPLWIAHYTKGSPKIPSPWTEWTFWQYSDKGVVQGVESPVDMCVYNGTLTGLKLFAGYSAD